MEGRGCNLAQRAGESYVNAQQQIGLKFAEFHYSYNDNGGSLRNFRYLQKTAPTPQDVQQSE